DLTGRRAGPAIPDEREEVAMPLRSFLKIDKVPGGSTDPAHPDWIDLESWRFADEYRYSGGQVGAGGMEVHTLRVIRLFDVISHALYHAMGRGDSLGDARLEVLKEGGGVVLQVTLTNVSVHNIAGVPLSERGMTDSGAMEVVTLDFAKMAEGP